jgi:7,8-dihydropterin-6-yl-methyl-4-(beta-D-ribofuranosyl)aminobenzene 5'-phosphate synthase
MELTIVYDNEAFKEGLKEGWGFSAHIEKEEKKILFDTGWDGGDLLYNLGELGFNPRDIDIIFLSHQHWDHTGGLNHVLAKTKGVTVYVPSSFSGNMKKMIQSKADLVEITDSQEIMAGVYTTGELGGGLLRGVKEQSLVVETRKGLIAIVGCSHPGLEDILEKASDFGKLYGVVGGFHGFNKYEALEGLDLIVPTHCTQHKKEIKDRYRDKVEVGGVGWSKII